MNNLTRRVIALDAYLVVLVFFRRMPWASTEGSRIGLSENENEEQRNEGIEAGVGCGAVLGSCGMGTADLGGPEA